MSDCCPQKAQVNETACKQDVVSEQDTACNQETGCKQETASSGTSASLSASPSTSSSQSTSCCPSDSEGKAKFDGLLWISFALVAMGYLWHLSGLGHESGLEHSGAAAQSSDSGAAAVIFSDVLNVMSHGMFELVNTMWWGVLAAFFFVGLLARIPQQMVLSVLGEGGSFGGVCRATLAGVLMDLCSHGILMVGMKLYERGASLGQVMAFLIASPWNSLSLTIILVALIGLPWTLMFIALSMIIALFSGWLFDRFVARGVLPANRHQMERDTNYEFWPQVRQHLAATQWNFTLFKGLLADGVSGSRIVLRWLLFGIVLATLLRSFLSLEDFQNWFGPSVLGLIVTLIAATIIEVCSEGSTPMAADIMTRARAPGNSFAFLMTGVSTDYTEVMVIKDTARSWKIALFLPLVTVPQVTVLAYFLNQMSP